MAISSFTEKSDPSFEERNWESARVKFKAKHADSDPKKIEAFLGARISIVDAKTACKEAQAKAKEQYSPALGGIMEKIEIAMSVGDLAMKSAPESVGLAWTGIRLCLHSVEDDFATFSLFSGACNDIIGILISCGVYGELYGGQRGPAHFQELHTRVVDYIPDIYSSILDFSYAMKKHMNRSKLERIGRGVFTSSSSKFQLQIQAIQNGENKMKGFASEAHQQLSIYYQEQGLDQQSEMTDHLRTIRETMESYVKMNEVFAERVKHLEEERKTLRKKTPLDIANEMFEDNRKKLNPSSDQEGAFDEKIKRRKPPTTCTWIFDLEEYKKWHDSQGSSVLWISGNGGHGKSILISSVIKQLRDEAATHDNHITQYFYCNAGDSSTRDSKRILDHIVFSLYDITKGSLETLEEANKIVSNFLKAKTPGAAGADASKEAISFSEAYTGLAKILKKDVYLVVDAIDECTDRKKQELLKTLCNVVKVDGTTVRIALCSRPEDDIITSLDGVSRVKVEDNNGPDIILNATTELDKLPGWTKTERELACKEIVIKAGSYFRYVELALSFLRQPWQRPLQNRLKELPDGIDNSYSQLLLQTDPSYLGLLRICLTWTILAAREVKVVEAVDAYSRVYHSSELSVDDISSYNLSTDSEQDLYIEQIRKAGSSFLEVDSIAKVISLRHSTVSDYFLNKEESPLETKTEHEELCGKCRGMIIPQSPFMITKKFGHLEIATTLLEHLNSPLFAKKFLSSKNTKKEINDVSQAVAEEEASTVTPNLSQNGESNLNKASDTLLSSEQNEAPPEQPTTIPDEKDLPQALKGTNDGSPEDGSEIQGPDPAAGTVITPTSPQPETGPTEQISDDETDADSDIAFDEKEIEYTPGNHVLPDETRYEITYWNYHLQLAERLWDIDQRTGPEWSRLQRAIHQFFNNDSPAFRSWVAAKCEAYEWPFTRFEAKDVRPIHVASIYGLVGVARVLLEQDKSEVSAKLGNNQQPIHLAVDIWTNDKAEKDEKYELIKLLLENGADANALSGESSAVDSPANSIMFQQPELREIQLLLKHGANFDQLINGTAPIHYAAWIMEDLEAFKAIVESVPDINVKDASGETPLHKLLSRKDFLLEKLELLIEKGADVHMDDNESQQPLYEIAAAGRVEGLSLILDAGADVNDDDINGLTALHIAALGGHTETAKILVKRGAQVARPDNRGRTPFFLACQSGNAETALYLLTASEEQGQQVASQGNKSGKTPLRKAAARGLMDVVNMLLKDGSIANTINDQDVKLQRTPLHMAAYNGRKDMVSLLLEHGAESKIRDKHGDTPLMLCIQGWLASNSDQYEPIIATLLQLQSDEVVQAGELLNAAAAKGSLTMINKLLDLDADPSKRDEHGWTAEQIAEQYGHPEAVELLKRRSVVSSMKPTKWAKTISKYAQLLQHGTEIEHFPIAEVKDNNWIDHRVSFLSNHPVPPGTDRFYYEITITSAKEPKPYLAFGLAQKTVKPSKWMPGFKNDFSPSSRSWAFHGDDGGTYCWPSGGENPIAPSGGFSTGDTIGCAFDCKKGKMFYTRNGERLMDWVFEGIKGRIYLVVGICAEAKITTNFGTDVANKPFKWEPGNTLDFDVLG